MKIIAIDRAADAVLITPPPLQLIADSALVMPGRPVFLPDIEPTWDARYHVAIRICRLGKNIAPRFAHRYYDAMTIAARFTPASMTRDADTASRLCGVADIIDGSLAIGPWVDIDHSTLPADLTLHTDGITTTIGRFADMAAESISLISRYATLKMGDIILLCHTPAGNTVQIGSTLTAGIDGQTPLLDIRIK